MIKIKVTQEDINLGVVNFSHCPIARAINKSGVYRTLCTGLEFIVVEEIMTTRPVIYKTPERARRFIRKFDKDKKSVKPQTFKLTKILKAM
jgi:hypothetical protein